MKKKAVYIGTSYNPYEIVKRKPKYSILGGETTYFKRYIYGTKTFFIPKKGYLLKRDTEYFSRVKR